MRHVDLKLIFLFILVLPVCSCIRVSLKSEIPHISAPVRGGTVCLVNQLAGSESGNFIQGSGFFVAPGLIVSNIHIVAHPGVVFAEGVDTKRPFRIEGVRAFDAENDIVVLKASGQGNPLSFDDSDSVVVDMPVYLAGFPEKIYALKPGSVQQPRTGYNWLLVSAEMSKGSSGGPVLNRQGRVIGVSVGWTSDLSVKYVIPSNVVKRLLASPVSIEPLERWQQRAEIRGYVNLWEGVVKIDAKDYGAAISAFNAAIAEIPSFLPVYFNRGIAHHERGELALADGDVETAAACFKAAIADYSFVGEVSENYTNLGFAKSRLADVTASPAMRLRLRRSALEDLTAAIRLDRVDADAYNNRGIVLMRIGAIKTESGDILTAERYYNDAVTDFTRAITLTPEDADVYNNRGIAHEKLGDLSAAAEDFQKASVLKSKPDDHVR